MSYKATIFGPVHAGKSTLAGYLKFTGARAEAEREISRARIELGHEFDEAQALAYLVDLSSDERRRNPKQSARNQPSRGTRDRHGVSTSKRIHISTARPIGCGEIDVIDTPGGWRKHRDQRLRGLFYGDVGIFAIEPIVDAVHAARLGEAPQARAEAFSALLTWVALRPDAPLIVAMTKSDLDIYDRYAFDRTQVFVDEVLEGRTKPFYIPVSINVRERTDCNITVSADGSRAYGAEKSLVEILAELEISAPPHLEEPVMLVAKRSHRAGRGTIYLGKVIAGSFERGDRVHMTPVATPHGGDFATLTAKATFLELTGDGSSVDRLVAGDIGGIGLGSGSLREIVEQESTLITHECVPIAQGRYLTLVISSLSRPIWLRTQAHIEVVWLGRYYQCKVYECEAVASGFKVGVLVQLPAGLAIPLRPDGTLVLDEVLVSSVAQEVEFVSARVTSLGHVVGLKIPDPADRDNLFVKVPDLRSVASEDILEGDEVLMERVTHLLAERVGGLLAHPYSVITSSYVEGVGSV